MHVPYLQRKKAKVTIWCNNCISLARICCLLNHCRLIKANKHSRCRHDGSATVLQPFSTRGIFCPPCFRGEGDLKCQTPDRQGNRKRLNRGVVVFQHPRAGNMSLNSRTEGSTQAPIWSRLWPKKCPVNHLVLRDTWDILLSIVKK